MRVPVDVLRVEANHVEQFLHPLAPAALRRGVRVDLERLADDVADRHPRVQRRVRVLHHHLHVPAQLGPGRLEPVPPLQAGPPVGSRALPDSAPDPDIWRELPCVTSVT
ncbi:hypothetical protein GCM10010429_52890 [Micromonospora olivasterospora]